MAKKRGGLAGLYDRNKGVIQSAAPVLAGMVGGPLAGAAVGAAMRGLDREGKSGIGFDLGQGLQGGLSGYGSGAAGAGIKNMFTGQLAKRAALKGTQSALEATKGVADIAIPGMPAGMGAAASAAPSAAGGGFNAAQYIAGDAPSQIASKAMKLGEGVSTKNPVGRAAGSLAKKAGSSLGTKEGLAFAGNALQTGANILGSQAQGAREERDYEEQQRQLQARAEMLALFAPQMASNLGMSGFMPQAAGMNASGRGNAAMTMQDYMGASGANATEEEFGPEMMDYVSRGRPASSSQGLTNYVNSRQNRR